MLTLFPRRSVLSLFRASFLLAALVCVAGMHASHAADTPLQLSKIRGKGSIFSGHVLTKAGKPIEGAVAEIGRASVKSDSDGFFLLSVTRAESTERHKFVLNIRKHGYGLVSKVYGGSHTNGRWTLTPATVLRIDPRQDNLVVDRSEMSNGGPGGGGDYCNGTYSSRTDWNRFSHLRPARRVGQDGQITTDVSAEVIRGLEYVESAEDCNPGIQVLIPADALVDEDGNPPSDEVEVSVSTVDIFDPDSMPGDYSVVDGDREGFMVPFGAGSIDITAGKKTFNLKKGMQARVRIPIHPQQLKSVGKPPSAIPLLGYDERRGVWREVGEAKLDSDGKAYAGAVSHFSTYNMDLVWEESACVAIDSRPIAGDYSLEVTVEIDGVTTTKTRQVDNTPYNYHAIYNLPANDEVILRVFDRESGAPLAPTQAVPTGPPATPDPNNPGDAEYDECGESVEFTPYPLPYLVLSEVPSQAGDFELAWVYEWIESHTDNAFHLYEKTSSTADYGASFIQIAASESAYQVQGKPAGTYWYEMRPYSGVLQAELPSSNEVRVVVLPSVLHQSLVASVNTTLRETDPNDPWNMVDLGCDRLCSPEGTCSSVNERWCFDTALKFDLPSELSGQSIAYAALLLWQYPDYRAKPSTVTAAALENSWDPSTITWVDEPVIRSQGAAEHRVPNVRRSVTAAEVPVSIDVTEIVQSWVSGAYPNNGLILYERLTHSLPETIEHWKKYYDIETGPPNPWDPPGTPDLSPRIVLYHQPN